MLTSRGLGTVLGDLASMGFDARWGVLGAADIGANHQRDRIWIVGKQGDCRHSFGQLAYANMRGHIYRPTEIKSTKKGFDAFGKFGSSGTNVAYSDSTQLQRNQCSERKEQKYAYACSPSWWETEPAVGRVADGMADRVDRLKAIGNGQVPLCAATAWRILSAGV